MYKDKKKRALTQRRHYMKKRSIVRAAKYRPCMDCDIQYPFYVMEFDHRIKKDKIFTIGPRFTNYSIEEIKQEIGKCDVVCANCHAARTYLTGIYKKAA